MGAYVINLHEYESKGTHSIALYVNLNNKITSCEALYPAGFGVEHIPKEI